jgi:putative endonuclease
MFYTYIIQSEQDESFYVGYTSDLDRRLKDHNEGLSQFTKRKRPWKLFYQESFNTKSEAIKREKFFKRQKNRSFYISLKIL